MTTDSATQAPVGRSLLITGGARSGKSYRAERILAAHLVVAYVATGPSIGSDKEWNVRIQAHRDRRPRHWITHETLQVCDVVRAQPPGGSVLVDCLALWVTGLIDRSESWAQPDRAQNVVEVAVTDLAEALARTAANVVLVTNEVGSGVVPATPTGRLFQDVLGRTNVAIAAACNDVELVACGLPLMLKGTSWPHHP